MRDDFLFDDPVANPALITAAREALGLTQADLADRLTKLAGQRVTQGYVSRIEKGTLAASGDRLAWFAAALEATPELLALDAKMWALGDGCLYHRHRASTKASTLRQLHARINLLRIYMQRLAETAGRELPRFTFEPQHVGGMDTAADAARAVRAALGLPDGAVASVSAVAERLGALVVPMSLGGREVDATSLHPPGEAPVFVVNTDAPAERLRFTLGHELGHVACAPDPGQDVEAMAQAFAAELLAPTSQIYPDLTAEPITPARLLVLKARWKVSAAAVLRRARDLAVVSDSRYRSVSAQISALGWQTAEPEPLAADRANVVPDIIAAAIASAGGIEAAATAAGTSVTNLNTFFAGGREALTPYGSNR
jgi:Zn-dependent peptidase ImmA (M78 family)/transcriptional regulator with XRE-family HTH domain